MTPAGTPAAASAFDALYRASDDPWGTRTRWYERRKCALLMASLSREQYDSAYEAGCGTGHISLALASRAARVVASDASVEAVAIATRTLSHRPNVTVARHRLPVDWPARPFDLIVLSEVLYFIDDAARMLVAASARASAGDHGEIVACDWRAAIDGYGVTGDDAHRRFATALDLPCRHEYVDEDFVLTAWSRDASSVATREGLREDRS